MNRLRLERFRAPLAALALVAAAACQEQELVDSTPPTPADLALEVSRADARIGDRIAVALVVNGAQGNDPIIGLQGRIRFDAGRLEYLGQELGATFAIANEAAADRGAIALANLNTSGLSGRTAVFAFAVRGEGYLSGLTFELDEAATRSLKTARLRGGVETIVAADLAVADVKRGLGVTEWRARFGHVGGPQLTPGDYRDNLRYGDADLSGSVSITGDAFYLAGLSVGNTQVFVGSDLPGAFGSIGKDAAFAGNVFPFNAPGLGEPGDALAPGAVSATNAGDISIFDASAVANEAVGNNQPVVGEIIPGRALVTRGRVVVSADITTNTTWTANNVYELAGTIRVNNDAVLTIEPGTQIEGQRPPTVAALYIERNGMIMANGTAREPILFTCTGTDATKIKGCWAGLAIAGFAPINEGTAALGPAPSHPTRNPTGGQNQGQLEGLGPLYGGGNATDNSGTLRYAVIEYGGREVAVNNELNNLTMGGVGSGSTIEFVQVRNGLDDGFEWFGGTVNHRYLVATGNSDDHFDATQGYRGSVQFVIIQHNPADADKGLEIDNAQASGAGNLLEPRTQFVLYNATLVGDANPNDPATQPSGSNTSEDAMHIRKGSHPTIANLLVHSWGRVFRLDDAATCDINGVAPGDELRIRNSIFDGYNFLANGNAFPAGTAPTKCSPTNADEGAFLNAEPGNRFQATLPAAFAPMIDPFDPIAPDFRLTGGAANAAATGGAAPPAGNTYIQNVAYIGAVPPGGANAIPWYAGWTRGYGQTQFFKPTAP
ncbi:MAG: hypothetical protein ACKVZ0_11810 [Gemmatimonadales bacterium]